MSKNDILDKKWRPVVLIILDGWGVAPASDGNAVNLAKPSFFNELIDKYPCCVLDASGEAVGLPQEQPGNGELGHLTLGAGRVCLCNEARIDQSIKTGEFFRHKIWVEIFQQLKKNQSKLHLVGSVSGDLLDAKINHLEAMLNLAKRKKFQDVYVHAVLGDENSDVGSRQAVDSLEKIMAKLGVGQLASLIGGFYAMDRDRRWERTCSAYKLLTEGLGQRSGDSAKCLSKYREQGVSERDFVPTAIVDRNNQPKACVDDNDVVVFFNFCGAGIRQLVESLVESDFSGFKRKKINNLYVASLTEYESQLPIKIFFGNHEIKNSLSEVLSTAGLKQLRLAETEKYIHSGYFFDGLRLEARSGEDRCLISSPKVSSYATEPGMGAEILTDTAIEKISNGWYDFVVINLAAVDMVGHSGDLSAAIEAIKRVDDCLGRLVNKIIEVGGVALITADHGNAEAMMNWRLGEVSKDHTTNPVPLVIVGKHFEGYNLGAGDAAIDDLSVLRVSGDLTDVAPTILRLLGLEKPAEMTGESLL